MYLDLRGDPWNACARSGRPPLPHQCRRVFVHRRRRCDRARRSTGDTIRNANRSCWTAGLVMHRLALVTSLPIQYQVPWFRALAQVTDLEVFYCHRQNSEDQAAAGFDVPFQWDIPLFDGYAYSFLQNVAARPDVSSFSGCDTPEVADRLRAGRFDACLVSGWYLKSYLQAIWACKHAGIPVLTRGYSQLGTPRSKLFTVAKYLPYRWLLR